ncbi:MAG TPA: hypothetical protein VM674_03035 [Candidatus Acidoferrum sp.]|nr:hypothetical protein [Candidatus Acidoferrum sp.]
MPHAIYCFLDGETLHGDPPRRELDSPVVETTVHNLGTNNRGAFLPLSSLKYVLLDSRPPTIPVDMSRHQRVAIHFVDHEVLRGYSDRDIRASRYGVTLSLVSPDQSEVKDLAIPFTALKGIFYLKTWEGGDSPMLESDWVPRVLEAREQEQVRRQYGVGGKPRRRMPLLERILRRRKIAE